MGLAVSRHCQRAQWYHYSEKRTSTTFGFFFPAVEKEAGVEIETDEELPTGYERILFIDDEESNWDVKARKPGT